MRKKKSIVSKILAYMLCLCMIVTPLSSAYLVEASEGLEIETSDIEVSDEEPEMKESDTETSDEESEMEELNTEVSDEESEMEELDMKVSDEESEIEELDTETLDEESDVEVLDIEVSEFAISDKIVLEAENAILSNGAQIKDKDSDSSNKLVENIGTNGNERSDGMVTFSNIQIENGGSYLLKVYYVAWAHDRYFDLYVNDEKTKLGCTDSGGFELGDVRFMLVEIELQEGTNTIAFGCDGWYSPNLDKIEISPSPIVSVSPMVFEAEEAKLLNGAKIKENPTASGEKQIEGIGTDGNDHADGKVCFNTINVGKSGTYFLKVYYASGSNDRYFDLYVNGMVSRLNCFNSGSFDIVAPTLIEVELKAGLNTIEFGCNGWYAPNLDKIEVFAVGLEAEEAKLSNGATVYDNSNASGGKHVSYIGTDGNSHADGTVTYNDIYVSKSGEYLLKIYYASASKDRYFDLHINGTTQRVNCTKSGDSNEVACEIVEVNLNAGENTIAFGCADYYAPSLDKIEIVLKENTASTALEAENAILTNSASIKENSAASGGKQVQGIGTDGNSHPDGMATFTNISIAESGTYYLKIFYASGSDDRYFDLYVNEDVRRLDCFNSGSFEIISSKIVEVQLNAGMNKIAFGCNGWYAPNLDKIELFVGQKFYDIILEAEDAQLTNGAEVENCETASSGQYVKNIGTDGGNHDDGTVTFPNILIPERGKYTLTVYYASGSDDRYFDVYINDEKKRLDCQNTGGFDMVGSTFMNIELFEGSNTIAFACADGYAPNLDKIEITMGETILGVTYEAEDAILINNVTIKEYEDASGGAYVYNIGSDGKSRPNGTVLFSEVEAERGGIYKLRITYASGSTDRYFKVSINGSVAMRQNCPNTGDFETFGTVDMEILLNTGNNKIAISCDDWYAPNLDKIEIFLVQYDEPSLMVEGRISLEAENAELSRVYADFNSSACSGGGKVNDIGGDQKGTVTFKNINISKAGTYALDVSYCTASDRAFDITINGNTIHQIFKAGSNWDVPNNRILLVELQAGENEIVFGNNSGYAPNLDKIELYPCEVLENGVLMVIYDINHGVYSIIKDGRTMIHDAFASVVIEEETFSTYQYTGRTMTSKAITDSFGEGSLISITNIEENMPTLVQEFYVYPQKEYLLTKVTARTEDGKEISTNWISPLSVNGVGAVENAISENDYFLQVPFDNDGWVKFETANINSYGMSHEVTAIFHAANGDATGQGLILGSITHGTWKTGIDFKGSGNQIDKLKVYGGANSTLTRDKSPHGKVTGQTVESPLIFVGCYENWQEGMDMFSEANTYIVPKKEAFTNQVPLGWNSWGSVQTDINIDLVKGVSDYIADNLHETWKDDEDDIVYVNLDSYWDMMTEEQMKEFVEYCKANGQKAGIYWGPFVCWHGWGSLAYASVEGTNDEVKYSEIILRKADGSMYGNDLDGAFPIDMTHPAAQARVDYFIDKFKELGFEYIKLDFLTHGALEGEHYNDSIQTGTQAYNFGMNYVKERIDGQMFINLSIAPTFPYQYADGKRIGCDSYYRIDETEYTLNGLTYGFWQKGLYEYPDPDHIVVWGKDGRATLQEARSRVTSGILLGTSFLAGDNFVNPNTNYATKEEADARFRDVLGNRDIINIAKTGKIFTPYTLQIGNTAADTFMMKDGDTIYFAVLNYSGNSSEKTISVSEYVSENDTYTLKELWGGTDEEIVDGNILVSLDGKDSKVYALMVEPTEPTITPSVTPRPSSTPTPIPRPSSTPTPTPRPSSTPTPTPTVAPSNEPQFIGEDGKVVSGWESAGNAITDLLKEEQNQKGNSEGGLQETVIFTINMGNVTELPKEILAKIQGENIELRLEMGNGVTWMISGEDITGDVQDIDLSVDMNKKNIAQATIGNMEKEYNLDKASSIRQFALSHNGDFGFTATLELALEKEIAGKIANLFYFNPLTRKLELQSVDQASENGVVRLSFTHASDYVLVTGDEVLINDDLLSQITVRHASLETPTSRILYLGGTSGHVRYIKAFLPSALQEAVDKKLITLSISSKADNENVTVSKTGTLKPKALGKSTVTTTVKVGDKEFDFLTAVTVKNPSIKIVKAERIMKVEEKYNLTIELYGYAPEEITWATLKRNRAVVSKNAGKLAVTVNAISIGEDMIVVKVNEITAKEYSVTVIE